MLLLSWLFIVKLTVYCPVLLYVYTGFFSVELFPSPNVHFHELGDPVLWSIKLTLRGADPEVGIAEKAAPSEFETAIYFVFVNELLPFALLAVNVTVYNPVLLYVYVGFFSVEFPPSPKVHLHEFGDPVLWSVKLTVRGTFPEVEDAEKLVAGTSKALETAIQLFFVTTLLPFSLFAVSVTEYSPDLLYTCTGFFSVEFPPSPKVHFHEFGDPVLWSVKLTLKGAFPEVEDAEKLVVGASKMLETAM